MENVFEVKNFNCWIDPEGRELIFSFVDFFSGGRSVCI